MSAEERQRWTKLPLIDCRHCGAPLYARYDYGPTRGFVMGNAARIRARGRREAECFTRHVAGPYDGFKAAKAYDSAVFDDTKEEEPMTDLVAQQVNPLAVVLSDPERLKDLDIEKVERLFALNQADGGRRAARALPRAVQRRAGGNGPGAQARG